jgi:hypothetical protein
MDRMAEEGFYLERFNNGSPAKRTEIFANSSTEWWSTVAQLIERRAVIIPNDEKLIAQLTSRRKQYDSRGRERLESKADLRARGVESPDRADAIIGAIVMAQDRQVDWNEVRQFRDEINRRARFGPGRSPAISPGTSALVKQHRHQVQMPASSRARGNRGAPGRAGRGKSERRGKRTLGRRALSHAWPRSRKENQRVPSHRQPEPPRSRNNY